MSEGGQCHRMAMDRIFNEPCYRSDCKLDKGGAETSEGDAQENPAQVAIKVIYL